MNVPPAGISPQAWQEAVNAGFHATPEASRREVEEILVAALPVLGLLPAQAGPPERRVTSGPGAASA